MWCIDEEQIREGEIDWYSGTKTELSYLYSGTVVEDLGSEW